MLSWSEPWMTLVGFVAAAGVFSLGVLHEVVLPLRPYDATASSAAASVSGVGASPFRTTHMCCMLLQGVRMISPVSCGAVRLAQLGQLV
jgi:hypothetical protein